MKRRFEIQIKIKKDIYATWSQNWELWMGILKRI
jgi:hypothetical protein